MNLRQLALRISWAVLALCFARPAHAGFLNGVFSRDGVDVIAVGDSGMIYRSVDGGVRWAKSYQGSTPLRAVAGQGLTLLIVGDGGKILRSTDAGGTWTTFTASGSPNLLDVVMPNSSTAYAVGSGGTALKSVDGGASWSPLGSGTSNTINRARFVDATHGWIVGNGGFSARTPDGGVTWSPSGPSTPNSLYAVDQLGSRIWIAGANGTCWKSINDGASWTPINLKIDSRSDVRAVTIQSADSVFIAGGGGFLRRSTDDGATWTFLQHTLMGEISDMMWVGQRGFVSSIRSPAVMHSNDGGNSWLWAVTTNINQNWVQKLPLGTGQMRGSTFALNGIYRNEIYAAVGNHFYESRDDGETWTQFSTLPSTYDRVNAFLVSPKDSLQMVCTANSPMALLYSNDGGASWTTTLSHAFGEYGIPLEMNPDQPDTVLFGGDSDALIRSTNFGKTWSTFGSTVFRSPCDLIVVPESDSNVVLVADGITGVGNANLWRSTDGGAHFTQNYTTTGSEVPGMSMCRLRNTTAFATNWTSGGVERTQNRGLQWTQIATTASGWGTDVCKEDPNLVLYGVYSGGVSYLSFDGGNSFSGISLVGSNESFYARDRNCIFAATAGGGVFKLITTYSLSSNAIQTLTVNSANGGEVWAGGSVHNLTWTASNVVLAKIEYRRTPADSWQLVATVPGYYGSYAWTVPFDATTSASIRVSDAWDATPSDTSDAQFTIATPMISTSKPSFDFGSHPIGSITPDSMTVTNTGTGTLHITTISTAAPGNFPTSPFNMTVAPGLQYSVYVAFAPTAVHAYTDTLTIASDAANTPNSRTPLAGVGLDTLSLAMVLPNGGEVFPYGTSQKLVWTSMLVPNVDLDYRVGPTAPWLPIASNVPAAGHSYVWTVPNAPTSTARVRITQSGGGPQDLSDADFSIVVPQFASSPMSEMDFDKTVVGLPVDDSLRITNAGTGPLSILMISSSQPRFVPHRTSLTIPPGGSDTVGVTFTPVAAGFDTATITFTTNDPGNPHALRAVGVAGTQSSVGGPTPTQFALMQNQPNPFRTTTVIRYGLPRDSDVSLELFNLQGERVATLVRGSQSAGNYAVEFDPWHAAHGTALSTGVYFYRFRAGEFSATKKMLLMR